MSRWRLWLLKAVPILSRQLGVAWARITGSAQEIRVMVGESYSPAVLVVTQGIPLRITFEGSVTGGQTAWVVFSQPKMRRRLHSGCTTIELLPSVTGEHLFTSGSGDIWGRIIVLPQKYMPVSTAAVTKR